MLSHELSNVVRHHAVVENIAVRRTAVIACVECVDMKLPAQTLRERMPVVRRSEESVEDKKGLIPGSVCLIRQLHAGVR